MSKLAFGIPFFFGSRDALIGYPDTPPNGEMFAGRLFPHSCGSTHVLALRKNHNSKLTLTLSVASSSSNDFIFLSIPAQPHHPQSR